MTSQTEQQTITIYKLQLDNESGQLEEYSMINIFVQK